jgi:2-oxoglutarate/2-oxoacid ferredoxin oxidoreductase subunit alpha
MRYNILFGGEAGQGPNILTNVLGEALVKLGYFVYYSRDYQSLIRGGHNFNVLTFSDSPVHSNDSKMDVVVSIDEATAKIHEGDLKKDGILLDGDYQNMYFAGQVFKVLNLPISLLEDELRILERRFGENIKEAREGYEKADFNIKIVKSKKNGGLFVDGNEGISEGAINSGIDMYYAYPMTPSTSVLTQLAQKERDNDYFTMELENEISVINATIGSAMTGEIAMCGTSGGGFDLMTESISLAGVAEVPVTIFLSMRPGPGTGVATYTSQGDLNMARHSGHGEFNRVVFAPGSPTQAYELTNQAIYFSQKFGIPSIVLSDKHLGESFYTIDSWPKIEKIKKTRKLKRYNSYEKDSEGSATEDPEIIEENVLERRAIGLEIEKESFNFSKYEVLGNKKSKNVVVSWGSTRGAIIDAIEGLDVKFIQIKYIEPFPVELAREFGENLILVENSSRGQLGDLIAEKTGIIIEEDRKILRFDGRPFLCDELKKELEGKLK